MWDIGPNNGRIVKGKRMTYIFQRCVAVINDPGRSRRVNVNAIESYGTQARQEHFWRTASGMLFGRNKASGNLTG